MKKNIIILLITILAIFILLLIPINISFEGAPPEKIRLFYMIAFIIWRNPKIIIGLIFLLVVSILVKRKITTKDKKS